MTSPSVTSPSAPSTAPFSTAEKTPRPWPWLPALLLAGGWLTTAAFARFVRDELSPGQLQGAVWALGGAFAVLLALAVWFAQLVAARARMLERLNQEIVDATAEARESEAELHRLGLTMKARAEERTRDLETFVEQLETVNYIVSHDLRSPLGAILNFAALLEEDKAEELGPEGLDFLGRISRNARSAVSIMDALLVYSRVARTELAIEPVALKPLIEDVARHSLQPRDEAVDLIVRDVPSVRGDRKLLETAVQCLLENTLDFPRREARTRITVDSVVQGDHIDVTLHDSSACIDTRPEDGEAAGEPRARGRLEKHGIGLATVARVADRLDGRAWVESTAEDGATFHLLLPKG